jgi:hypothetical protein
MSEEPEVKYMIMVKVGDERVFESFYYTIDSLEEDLHKAEEAVRHALQEKEWGDEF